MNTPNYAVLGETGLLPVFVFTTKLHLTYITKTLKVDQNRFIHQISDIMIKYKLGWARWLYELLERNQVITIPYTLDLQTISENISFVLSTVTTTWELDYAHKILTAEKHLLYKHLYLK